MAKASTIPSLDDALHVALKAKFEKTDVVVGTAQEVGYLSDVHEFIPTGIYALDLMLSRGKGLPVGRFMEVFGMEEGGKSAFCEFLAGLYVNSQGAKPHWLDLERTLTKGHLASYGVGPGQIYTPDLETLEQGWDYVGATLDTLSERVDALAKAKLPPDPPQLFIVDSIAAATTDAELDDDAGDAHMAETARAMSKGFRKYNRKVSRSRSTVVFVNQVRSKMNARPGQKQTLTPGGFASRFGSSIRLELARISNVEGKVKGRAVGHIVKVTAVKNRLAPRYMTAEFVISYTCGIDVAWSNFMFFKEHGWIQSAGTAGWRWKGREATFRRIEFTAFCRDNLAAVEKARDAVFAKVMATFDTAPATDLDGDADDGDDDAPSTPAPGAEADAD